MTTQNQTTENRYFWAPGQSLSCIDQIVEHDGELIGLYGGKTVGELQAEYPGGEVVDFEEFMARVYKELITAPQEITKEQWMDALECLPPLNWQRQSDAESFKHVERLAYDVTAVYVRIGQQYFVFNDRDSLSHADAVAKARTAISA